VHSHSDACFQSAGKTDNSIAETKFSGNLSQVELNAFDFGTRTDWARMESVETQTFRFMLLIAVQVDFNYSNESLPQHMQLHFRTATNWSERHAFLAKRVSGEMAKAKAKAKARRH